jgi:hypothetical protein
MDEEANDLGPASFFGAQSEDIPPIFQQPRSMAGFSATATYEVPKRSAEETKELIRKLGAPALHAPANQDEDRSEPEHESKAENSSEMWLDDTDRDSEFSEFDGSILHGVSETEQVLQHGQSESESEEEEDPLLSARSLYKTFGSTFKITSLVGGDKNDASFQKTFDKIQESIDLLSSDDDSEDERVK